MVSSRFARLCVTLAAIGCLAASPSLPTVNAGGPTCGDAGVVDETPAPSPSKSSPSKLPIFYFHGTNGNAENSVNYRANLTAEGRSIVALNFCSDKCSTTTGLNKQVELGAAQVRSIVAANQSLYANGYIFIAHSQGATIAKFVIQEMDDHKVKTFVSLAASANGRFYGPQPEDVIPAKSAISLIGSQVSESVFNASSYASDPNAFKGRFQRDLIATIIAHPELQASVPQFNQARSPYVAPWIEVNTVIPVYNNLVSCGTNSTCLANQKRHKDNFVRVDNIHLFASPNDSTQAPYQTGLYGFYSDVNSLDEVESKFEDLVVLDMTETKEYKEDLYGLKTLNEAGRLHRHSVPNVDHNCWNRNSTDNGWSCVWEPIYSKYVYPLLQ
ncbi:hypothetical protein Gpo141_00013852 [Globisporangium polare]